VSVERLHSGCCGLAGNFGFERGHLDVSRACAEQVLLPALRAADPNTAMLAEGFSCRTQIHEFLAAVLDSDTSPDLDHRPATNSAAAVGAHHRDGRTRRPTSVGR
jgi:Fe-S oxidoreductase